MMNHSTEKSLKYYRDLQNTIETARGEGEEEGLEKGDRDWGRARYCNW